MGPPLGLPARHAVQLAGEADVLDPGQPGDERVGLRHEPDQPPQPPVRRPRRGRRRAAGRAPGRCPTVGGISPIRIFSSVRLAGPVRPEQPDPARRQAQRDVVQGGERPERAGDPVEVDQRRLAHRSGRLGARGRTHGPILRRGVNRGEAFAGRRMIPPRRRILYTAK